MKIAAAPVTLVDLAVAYGFFHAIGLISRSERTDLGGELAGRVIATGAADVAGPQEQGPARTASGELPARVHAVVPLDQAADGHQAAAKGGGRGRYVLQP